ncbi:MAG: arylsulfotransferase family protein [Acidimicrobiales bacterium]
MRGGRERVAWARDLGLDAGAAVPGISRRSLLRGLGGLAGGGLVTALTGCSSPAQVRHAGQGAGRPVALPAQGSTGRGQSPTYRSAPRLRPPLVVVDVRRPGTAPGVVLTDCHGGTGQQGPMIIGDDGDLVWFEPLSDHGTPSLRAFNLRVQRYRGHPVLCWFEGAVVDGHGRGHYVLADAGYRQVAMVEAANGLQGDLHELFLTDRGTAVFTAYGTASADLSAAGGASDGTYFYGEVQEVDVATGRLVFSWRSDHHVGFDESYAPAPRDGRTPWDYFHINSINVDPSDGNLIVSARNCSAFYKVDHSGGGLMWRLGGKRSDFAMGPGTGFAYQHDVTPHAGGTFTIFDNEGSPWVSPPSRGLVLLVDEDRRRATLRRQYHHFPPVESAALGSVQDLPDGHVFIGWGTSTYFTEYDASGQVVYDGRLGGAGLLSYRAFRQPWEGRPRDAPAVAVERSAKAALVYVSWNGATQVSGWRVLGGRSAATLASLGTAPRVGFETRIAVPSAPSRLAVDALDASGRVLGRSAVHRA